MTLLEQFYKAINYFYINSNRPEMCEKIAEDFAIGFYEWRSTTPIRNIDQYTNKECVEKYKNEKGL